MGLGLAKAPILCTALSAQTHRPEFVPAYDGDFDFVSETDQATATVSGSLCKQGDAMERH
jgi:hypothetical protein